MRGTVHSYMSKGAMTAMTAMTASIRTEADPGTGAPIAAAAAAVE